MKNKGGKRKKNFLEVQKHTKNDLETGEKKEEFLRHFFGIEKFIGNEIILIIYKGETFIA